MVAGTARSPAASVRPDGANRDGGQPGRHHHSGGEPREVGDGEVSHQGKTPAVRARVSLVSVVTIGLGGQMGLSEGLAT